MTDMTDVEWHKLPEDPPKKKGAYLVTVHAKGYPRHIRILNFTCRRGFLPYDHDDQRAWLKAWADLPKPYRGE